MIVLSIYPCTHSFVDHSITRNMLKIAKRELKSQGITIAVNHMPLGRGAGGMSLSLRIAMMFSSFLKTWMQLRAKKSFRINQPTFGLRLSYYDDVEQGMKDYNYLDTLRQMKEVVNVGYMLSKILKNHYGSYEFYLDIDYSVPNFSYYVEVGVAGILNEEKIGIAFNFMPEQIKSHVIEKISIGDGLLVERQLIYRDASHVPIKNKIYRYFKFDKAHYLTKRGTNLQRVKGQNHEMFLYAKYAKSDVSVGVV